MGTPTDPDLAKIQARADELIGNQLRLVGLDRDGFTDVERAVLSAGIACGINAALLEVQDMLARLPRPGLA